MTTEYIINERNGKYEIDEVAYHCLASYKTKEAAQHDIDFVLPKIVPVVAPLDPAAETEPEINPEPEHGKNGYCRKCHSYCYSDCEANS